MNKEPGCWPVVLAVQNGVAEAAWISGASKKTSRASGTLVANGSFDLKVAAWTSKGDPNEAVMTGRVSNDTITAAGQWRTGGAIVGEWKRTP